MKTKSLWLIASLILIASMILTACGPKTTPPPAGETQAPPAGEKVKVTIFIGMGTGTDPEQITAENALAAKFNSTHDNIEMEFLVVPYEQSREKFQAMVSGGTAPQLVGPMGVETSGQFQDLWEDLGPYIQRDNYDTSDFYGPAIELNKTADGKNIGLPVGLYPSFIFYNESAFDAAGVAYPTHDFNDKTWTLAKLREVAMQVTMDANGNNATSPDFEPANIVTYGFDDSWGNFRDWAVIWGAPNVGRPTTADFKTATVNAPEWVTGIQWYSDAIWVDHFMADGTALSAIDPANGDPFAVGGVAIWKSHTWYMGDSLNDLPFKWDIAPAPYNQKGEQIFNGDADVFAIPASAKNKDAAWEALKWLVNEENILEMCKIYGCMPARKSVAETYNTTLTEMYPGIDTSVVFSAANFIDVSNHEGWVPDVGRVNEILANALSKLMTEGENHDAQSLLDETNAEVQAILDEYWASH
jgi:multiple sugar transport system substrate-binding protein